MSGAIIGKPIGEGMNMDELALKKHQKYERLIATAKRAPPPKVAVAHPCDQSSLEGAVGATSLGLIAPILVGPAVRIRNVAAEFSLNISGLPVVETEHSHASAQRGGRIGTRGQSPGADEGQSQHR
jgi:phosphate acetyltransferase